MAQYREEFPDAPLYNDETRQRFVDRNNRRWSDPTAKESVSKALKQSWEDPQVRESRIEGMKQTFATDEWKEGHAERMSDRWRDPGFRSLMTETHRESWQGERRERTVSAMKRTLATPQQKQKRSEIAKERWKDKERNAQRSQSMRERWQDSDYRRRVRGRRKWWGPELVVRALLTEAGLYPGTFDDHVDVYTQRGRWMFNADFAAVSQRLVLHVDGVWYHHDERAPKHAWRVKRDRLIDSWCQAHGWSFLRVTDKELEEDPSFCLRRIKSWVLQSIS